MKKFDIIYEVSEYLIVLGFVLLILHLFYINYMTHNCDQRALAMGLTVNHGTVDIAGRCTIYRDDEKGLSHHSLETKVN